MASPEEMRETARNYARLFSAGDREGWLSLFVEEPVLIEPADAEPRVGREHFAQAFDMIAEAKMAVQIDPQTIIVNGDDVAVFFKIAVTSPAGEVSHMEVIEIYTLASDARIAKMRAFLG